MSFCRLEAGALPGSLCHLPVCELDFSAFFMGWLDKGQQLGVCSHCVLVHFMVESWKIIAKSIPSFLHHHCRMKRCSHSLVSLGGVRSHPAVPAIWRELPWTPLSHDHTQESSSTNHQMFALSCMMTMPWGTHCPLSAPINSVPWMDISEVSVWGFLWPRKGSS